MTEKKNTTLYVSLPDEDDKWIDNFRLNEIKQDKKQIKKNDIVKKLIYLGMDVINGKYLKLDSNVDRFVSQLREVTIEIDKEKFTYEKSKEQVYYMIIEKGLEHLND